MACPHSNVRLAGTSPFFGGEPELSFTRIVTDVEVGYTNNELTQPSCSNSLSVQKSEPSSDVTTLYINDPPYENYFYSDQKGSAQVVVTSPLPESDLSIIGPRSIFAWPAVNGGACTFCQPENGVNGCLATKVINSTVGSPLAPVYTTGDGYPSVGVKGVIRFSNTAVSSLSILGSMRAIRDFTEGPSLLHPKLQEGIDVHKHETNGVPISRLWLDNVTTTTLTFTPRESQSVSINYGRATFEAGEHLFSAHINYPQLKQLLMHNMLKDKRLIDQR